MARGDYLGEFEHVVLLAVARLGGEGYGTSVGREIEEVADREVSVGAVYATLDRLEEKGLVRSWEGDATPVRGGRARRHFEVTAEGHAALRETRAMLSSLWRGIGLEGEG